MRTCVASWPTRPRGCAARRPSRWRRTGGTGAAAGWCPDSRPWWRRQSGCGRRRTCATRRERFDTCGGRPWSAPDRSTPSALRNGYCAAPSTTRPLPQPRSTNDTAYDRCRYFRASSASRAPATAIQDGLLLPLLVDVTELLALHLAGGVGAEAPIERMVVLGVVAGLVAHGTMNKPATSNTVRDRPLLARE